MTQNQIAPWSQLDDELEDDGGIAARSGDGALPDGGGEEVSAGSGHASGSGLRWCRLNVTPQWAMVPLALASVWLVWGAVSAGGEGAGIPVWQALGILGLVMAAGATVVLSRIARRSGLAAVRRAIGQNAPQTHQVFEALPMSAEFKPLWHAVKQHSENIEKRLAALLDEHQQLCLALSLADTRRRQAETVIASVPDPILVVDAFDQLVLANRAAESIFGFETKDALRQALVDVIDDEKLTRMVRQAREADSRVAHRRVEHEIGERSYALSLSPIESEAASDESSPGGHGVVVLMREVTKEREAAKMKSEFVARAAHELRTPLSSIRAYVEMLVDGEAADEKTRDEYYDIIQTSADRLGRMIDNVLNISRIEAGTVRINKEPVAVSMVVKEATDMVRPQAEEKGITLTEELTPVAFQIMADRDMIYQAVLNLLSNAIKYTPQGGRVQVRMIPHEENNTICTEVRDNGVGIPEEDLPKMFGKFFRVEVNNKMAKGTGLGLNLVKHIVETIHDGKMTLESKVGKGSTFGMVLPLMS